MKNIRFYISLVLLLSTAFLIQNCDDTITENDVDSRFIPDKNISFRDHLQPVFQLKCATSGCHNYESVAAGLNMMEWTSIYRIPIVMPGDPDNSLLVLSVEGSAGLSPMPPLGSATIPLTSDQIRALRKWIEEGAKNN